MKDAHDRYIAHSHQPQPRAARRVESAPKLPGSFPAATQLSPLSNGSHTWLHSQKEVNQSKNGSPTTHSRALRSLKLERMSSPGSVGQLLEDQDGQIAQVQQIRSKSASLPDMGTVMRADGSEGSALQNGNASSQPGNGVIAVNAVAQSVADGDGTVGMRQWRPTALVLPDDSVAPTGLSPELLSAEPASKPVHWAQPGSKPSVILQNGTNHGENNDEWHGDEWDGRGDKAGTGKGADAGSRAGDAHGKAQGAGLTSKRDKEAGEPANGRTDDGHARVNYAQARVEDAERWPPASSWTMATATFEYRSITFNFRDPMLPGVLQPVIQVRNRHTLLLVCLHEHIRLLEWSLHS